ncbi:MAG: hypothetical protein CLLPBCKN_001350 [Chroococcidiopsis cubana SAG 39.79]|uniref:Uncharacterized protein n=1 Tax=Chroococcidiopsis cubana SAG 39.79 TaxID=388085 RepID=A0AB37UC73_9CYAN|nr:hypothetical protein [Chroococcidiopsis cubana]MDZ4871962.1 hypothetical protein [Chroococcidiopsis cubana SAG 39.79]PSB64932.1 hypothetical protein C7B79_07595 [Chroococcidiopsis cubana CCALA 043]RUT05374.1 hypothetical protein DSM107010_55270 [Chroococcidiopsis cubana SAG 39.79]
MLSSKLQALIIKSYKFNREQKLWLMKYVESIANRDPKLFIKLLNESDERWGTETALRIHEAATYLLSRQDMEWGNRVAEVAIQLLRLENQLAQ